jgi:serine/threonine protein kinase/tetratricopeptide (TPR) repeat protein
VVAHLGKGGMGTVYRARDPQLERDVAIKVMTQPTGGLSSSLEENQTVDLRTDAPASADDLLREARMMARLSHPNVLPVYEVGLVDGALFVVMEHIDGCDLREWIATRRTNEELIDVFVQAARGLSAAHDCGIVHRDFKPENLLVGRDGRVRVADFGLSRLVVRPHHAMRRVDDNTQGTPRYMAPELWRGDSATPQSDIYAFCVTLAEAFDAERGRELDSALRAREVSARLRDAIHAGVAEDPRARPTWNVILAALTGRSPIRTRWLVAGALGLLASASAIGFAMISDPPAACALPPPAAWDDSRAAIVRGLISATPRNAAAADPIVRSLADHQHEIGRVWQTVCDARAAGALTELQARARQSCLLRRHFELEARVGEFMHRPHADLVQMFDRARIADVAECTSLNVPAIKNDPEPVAALYRRFVHAEEFPLDIARADELLAIARDAKALNERELEARATFNAGQWRADLDQVSDGDALMQRGYGIALELRAIEMQALMLVRRSRNAIRRADPRGALSLARLALDLVENQATSLATRAKVYAMLAYVANELGDYQGVLDRVAKGMQAIDSDGHRLPAVELDLRQTRVTALKQIEGRGDEVLTAARDNVTWARRNLGERSEGYSVTLNTLAFSLLARGDRAAALDFATKAAAAAQAALPADSARLATQRIDYASILQANGKLEEAREVLTAALDAAQHNEALRQQLPLATFHLGRTLCKLDRCVEGLAHLERAVELGTSQYGAEHQYTQAYRYELLGYQLELDRGEDAERTYAALERNYAPHRAEAQLRLIILHGIHGVGLALLRGQPHEGEELARDALARWDELEGEGGVRAGFLGALGATLVEQKRWAEARAALEQAVQVAKAHPAIDEETIAALETLLARSELGLGDRRAALDRAKRAQAVLARYPMQKHARADLEELLGTPVARGQTRSR